MPDLISNKNIQAFYSAVQKGEVAQVKQLLEDKVDPNEVGTYATTPLMEAAGRGHVEIVEMLLAYGADITALSPKGCTVISFAVVINDKKKRDDIEGLLIQKGAKKFASHRKLIDLMQELKYPNVNITGVCHGIACVTVDYVSRGRKGIGELNNILHVLGYESTDVLSKKIKAAEDKRIKIVNTHKTSIKESITAEIKETDPDLIFKTLTKMMGEEETRELIDAIIKSQFSDTTKEERKIAIDQILHSKCLNDTSVADFEIENLINAQINFLTQKKLTKLIRQELGNDSFLLDVSNFLQNIHFSQLPQENRQLFARNIADLLRQNAFVTFQLMSSIGAERQGLAKPKKGGYFGSYTKDQLEAVLNLWKEQIQNQQIANPINFHIKSSDHAASLGYLPNEKAWVFSNYHGNELETIKEGNEKQLVERIFSAFPLPPSPLSAIFPKIFQPKRKSDQVVLGTRIFSAKQDEAKLNQMVENIEANDSWKTIHAISQKEKVTAMEEVAIAVVDIDKAKEIVKSKHFVKRNKVALLLLLAFIALAAVSVAMTPEFTTPLLIFYTGMIVCVAQMTLYEERILRITKQREQVEASVLANAERDAGFPNTNRQRLENVAESRLFTRDHKNYLSLQRKWENVWMEIPKDDAIQDFQIERVKNPGFFDFGSKLFGYHKHYKNICSILSKKYHSEFYASDMREIDIHLDMLVNAPWLKHHLLDVTYDRLKDFQRDVKRIMSAKKPVSSNAKLFQVVVAGNDGVLSYPSVNGLNYAEISTPMDELKHETAALLNSRNDMSHDSGISESEESDRLAVSVSAARAIRIRIDSFDTPEAKMEFLHANTTSEPSALQMFR